jgi:hypothetical protein
VDSSTSFAGVGALLCRRAFAQAIAAVVEHKGAQSEIVENPDALQQMRDIATVAMAEQHHAPGLLARQPPAGQPHPIRAGKNDILVRKSDILGSRNHFALGHVDQVGLQDVEQNPHAHIPNQRE